MKHDDAPIFIGFSAAAVLALLFLWRTRLQTETVKSTIRYDGKDYNSYADYTASQRDDALYRLKSKIMPNEYILDGKLCTTGVNGERICFGGDPLDILAGRK